MVAYGAGPMVWENSYDWVSKAKRYNEVIVSNNEKAQLEDWTKMLVVETFTVSELYAFIRNENAAAARGWDVESVKQSLVNSKYNGDLGTTSENWAEMQDMLRNNDLSYSRPDNAIRVGRLYYREFPKNGETGEISEVWIDLDFEGPGFLYKKTRKYKNWNQVVCPFMLNRGDGKYHSIKGLGVRMYALLIMRERLENQKVDAANTMSSLHVRATGNAKISSTSLVQMGPYTAWKDGFEPMNFNTSGAIEAADVVTRGLDALAQSNLSQFRPQVAQPKGNPRTAFEVAANVTQQAVVSKSSITKYYEQLDAFYRERFRRALLNNPLGSVAAKLAKHFQANLAAAGIPIKELFEACFVEATRTIGQGSSLLRGQAITEILGTVGSSVSEEGRVRIIDDFIASKAGHKHIAVYNPKEQNSDTEKQNTWDARVENNSLRNGMPIEATETQNHQIHSSVHIEAAAEAVQSVPQGADLQEVFVFVSSIIEHVAANHLLPLLQDPLRQHLGKAIEEQLKGLQQQAADLEKSIQAQNEAEQEQVAAQQQAQAIQDGSDPNTQIRAAEAQSKMQEREAKAAQQLRQKEEKHDQSMRQSAQSFAASQATTRSDT